MAVQQQQRFTRDDLAAAILRLPADATVDDAIERLYFLRDAERARAQIAADESHTQDAVEQEMRDWRE